MTTSELRERFPPTTQEEIKVGIEENFKKTRETLDKEGKFVGAGRRYFQRGTPGYLDNLLPIGPGRVVEAVREIYLKNLERLGFSVPVSLLDVGGANGRAAYDVADYHGRHGIPMFTSVLSASRREYRENPPVNNGTFLEHTDAFSAPIKRLDGSETIAFINYENGNMHDLPGLTGERGLLYLSQMLPHYDVIMSMAAIKYSHDPWKVFADALRILYPQGYLFVGHLQRGTGSKRSTHPVYDIDGNELAPRELIDRWQELNPDSTFRCNEDRNRMVKDHLEKSVFNDERFYTEKKLSDYREQLIGTIQEAQKAGDMERRRRASLELGRLAGLGFLNVSVKKGDEEPYIGLFYVGHNYANGASYVFVPDRDRFMKMQRDGYQAVGSIV